MCIREFYASPCSLIPNTSCVLQQGSGLLSGDMSAAMPESIERAEEVLAYANVALSKADANGGDEMSTEVREWNPCP